MSWKNVKEFYRIGHAVCVTDAGICIGSPYIHNIIVISLAGIVTKRYEDRRSNEDLHRYQQEFDADPAKLKQLVQSPDTFTASVPVYTYDDGDILEKQCEKPGWPNVTHDGCMMYENTFSTDKAKVVSWAKRNAAARVNCAKRRLTELQKDLADAEKFLAESEGHVAKLEASFPDVLSDKT